MKKLFLLKCVGTARTAIDLIPKKNGLYVEVSIEDKSYKMLIDTGANTIILADGAFKELSNKYKVDRLETILMANGTSVVAPIVHNIVYNIGDKQILGYAAIVPMNRKACFDGIIGLPLLKLLKASIDIDNNKLYISGDD